jgi:hypothetical protein
MKKMIKKTAQRFVYYLGIRPSETSPLFSPRRDYRLRMSIDWANGMVAV